MFMKTKKKENMPRMRKKCKGCIECQVQKKNAEMQKIIRM